MNATVQAFQSLNVQWARERSRRRREFLAEQLAQTDSMLARAQARAQLVPEPAAAGEQSPTSWRRSRARARSSRPGCAELDADRRTLRLLPQQLKSSDEATRAQALRALGTAPAMADNAAIGGIYHQLLIYQDRLDSMTTGPWRASPNNPDV